MRIVHFSDIHAGGWVQDFSGYFDKRLLGAVNYVLRRSNSIDWNLIELAIYKIKLLAPDIVICTGDLTSISEPSEFQKAVQAISPLVNNPDFDFLYVPGNHDHYVKNRHCVLALNESFYNVNRNRWRLDELPLCHNHGSVKFVLLNQACPVNCLMSTGRIDNKSQNWLINFFDQEKKGNDIVVLVNHFPIFDKRGNELSFRRRCENNELLQSVLLDGTVDIALCGHIHSNFSRKEESGGTEFCAGSLTLTGMLNVIDIDTDRTDISQCWVNVREKELIV